MLRETDPHIRKLPMPPSDDAQGEIIMLVSNFSRELASYVEGTPDPDGIHQAIRPLHNKFAAEIRRTAQTFSPFERRNGERYLHPSFHPLEEQEADNGGNNGVIHVDEVKDMADQ
jgi:hypothetical protein